MYPYAHVAVPCVLVASIVAAVLQTAPEDQRHGVLTAREAARRGGRLLRELTGRTDGMVVSAQFLTGPNGQLPDGYWLVTWNDDVTSRHAYLEWDARTGDPLRASWRNARASPGGGTSRISAPEAVSIARDALRVLGIDRPPNRWQLARRPQGEPGYWTVTLQTEGRRVWVFVDGDGSRHLCFRTASIAAP